MTTLETEYVFLRAGSSPTIDSGFMSVPHKPSSAPGQSREQEGGGKGMEIVSNWGLRPAFLSVPRRPRSSQGQECVVCAW